mgnify:CR=1 FL=1
MLQYGATDPQGSVQLLLSAAGTLCGVAVVAENCCPSTDQNAIVISRQDKPAFPLDAATPVTSPASVWISVLRLFRTFFSTVIKRDWKTASFLPDESLT